MQRRKLGNTEIEVSEVAFGTVELGIPYGIGIEDASQMLPEEAAIQLLRSALDKGINFYDTARQYGNSEALLGKAFKDRRSEVVIATKCTHIKRPDGSVPGETELKRLIQASLTQSLEALQTDYVDIFMLHDGDKEVVQHPVVKKIFAGYKRQGLIRSAGVSTYTPDETATVIETGGWEVVQVPFNLMDQRQSALFGKLQEKGIGIVIRSVLLKGLLSNRETKLHPALKEIEAHISSYQSLLKGTGYQLPQFATKFALSFPEVAAVLIGIDQPAYLQAAIDTIDGRYLDEAVFMAAKKAAFKTPGFINLHQWNVNGWLK